MSKEQSNKSKMSLEEYLRKNPNISVQEVCNICKCSGMKARKILSEAGVKRPGESERFTAH